MSRLAARDAGRVDAVIRDATRDPVTGVIGAQDLRRGSALIARALAPLLGDAERRPLVLGGDCTLLLGVPLTTTKRTLSLSIGPLWRSSNIGLNLKLI